MHVEELAREALETARFLYGDLPTRNGLPHPNIAHIDMMLADADADQFFDPSAPRHAVVVRRNRNIGVWRGGCD